MKVARIATVMETIPLTRNASQTSGSAKIVSYQCVVKWPKGIVGNRSEFTEKIKLVTIGVNTKINTNTT